VSQLFVTKVTAQVFRAESQDFVGGECGCWGVYFTLGALNLTENRPILNFAAFTIVAACVPVTKIAIMFWEYRLHFPLDKSFEPVALVFALVAAGFVACRGAHSLNTKLLRIMLVLFWSALAYVVVAFVPGCIWAPACL
jgi:hypothetical protein